MGVFGKTSTSIGKTTFSVLLLLQASIGFEGAEALRLTHLRKMMDDEPQPMSDLTLEFSALFEGLPDHSKKDVMRLIKERSKRIPLRKSAERATAQLKQSINNRGPISFVTQSIKDKEIESEMRRFMPKFKVKNWEFNIYWAFDHISAMKAINEKAVKEGSKWRLKVYDEEYANGPLFFTCLDEPERKQTGNQRADRYQISSIDYDYMLLKRGITLWQGDVMEAKNMCSLSKL